MGYKFIEGVSLADIAFEAKGKTLEETFESAADALTNTMIAKLEMISPKKTKKIELKAENEEKLLHDFLNELIFLKDAKILLFREYKIKIQKKKNVFVLVAELKGEEINQKKHELLVDAKAISWHMFNLDKNRSGYTAFVIVDV
ncbi:archease [Candidatus Micrarchaeota archaeon]|nr:archease [Candidatus Micrarchaeota archaeon]